MQSVRIEPDDQLWQTLVDHLIESGDARWVLDDGGQPKTEGLLFLAAAIDQRIVGSLTLLKQSLVIPASDWAENRDRSLRDATGDQVYEMFVQTFVVEEAFRRRGIGRALQQEGLRQTKQLGCYQMRSWSSLDREENYRLKLSLGFGFHPEIQETASGLKVSGGYFVKVV